MSLILTVEGEGFTSSVYEDTDGRIYFHGDFDVDVDGSGSSHGDPYFQPDTSLHQNGKALNADHDKYMVVPGQLVKMVAGIVLGCQGQATYKGKTAKCVVGDTGPRSKTGEGSYALAQALGINPSPISGGVDSPDVFFEFWPDIPATVDGHTYTLQAS